MASINVREYAAPLPDIMDDSSFGGSAAPIPLTSDADASADGVHGGYIGMMAFLAPLDSACTVQISACSIS